MQTAAAYKALHTVSGPVRCIETHVSWVFLTGAYAYKIKKPLLLDFLDYSTAARREQLCHEELRLNRRHAAELYLATVPIAGTPAAPRVGATDGPAFEHALRMRQFDPDQELSRLLQANDVTAGEIAAFACDLAHMHAGADPVESSGPFGNPARLHRVTLDNFGELARSLRDAPSIALLTDIRADLERDFARLEARMDSRRIEGRVRECHGDLHCGNIVRWRERLLAFDGLEFDPALRLIDVANDLAFLSMDLGAHARDDLRSILLQHWTEASGDYGAVELLPYYEAYRALVRAKVAAVRSRQAHAASFDPASATHPYLAWQRRQSARRAPTLVVMAGFSGSGKTWLAQRIGAAIGALHVRSDVERKRLAGLAPLANSRSAPDAGIYTREFNTQTYARLRECVRACLAGGESVVLDAANLRREEREAFVRAAAQVGSATHVVHCEAPREVLRARVAARQSSGADASEATLALLDRQPAWWEPLGDAERAITVAVDTAHPAQVDAALRRLVSAARRERS